MSTRDSSPRALKREDQDIEYKRSWREEYLKWVCGFANAAGGRMLIGVADDMEGNEIIGVADWKQLLETIPNQMRDAMGMIADVNHVRKNGKDLVEIVVPSFPVPISYRGVYYVRRGATNQRLSGPGLEAFLLKRRGLHWENLPCPRLKPKDISAKEIKRFKDLAIDKGRLDASVRRETKDNFIANLHLAGASGISYAGALLFTEKAEKWIPGAYVKVGKFGESDADLLYHDDVHGSLLEQAEKALDLIYFKYLKAKIRYENGLHRVEKFPFPREALRELILNALVHKDYSSGIPVQISVSDDRLYIANVGSLPEDWTVRKLLEKHSSRPPNPTIAGCVYLTGMIETWGRGIQKVFDECRKHGCPPPVYEVTSGDPGDIQVRIDAAPDARLDTEATTDGRGKEADVHGATVSATLNATVNATPSATVTELIIETIRANPGIRRPQLLSLIPSVKRGTLTRRLAGMPDLIEFRGAPKTGGYFLKDPKNESQPLLPSHGKKRISP